MLGTNENNDQICQWLWILVALGITSPVLRFSSFSLILKGRNEKCLVK